MIRPDMQTDPPLLIAFADRAAALPPEAWDRIGERCSRLDASTVEAFLGRVGLYARSVTPELDPYKPVPLVRSWMAALGGVYGVLHEAFRLGPPDPQGFERAGQPRPDRPGARPIDPGLAAMMRIESLAQRQQKAHPGAAAALRAVSMGLLTDGPFRPAEFDAIYRPFEPEIPLASLSPGEHAA